MEGAEHQSSAWREKPVLDLVWGVQRQGNRRDQGRLELVEWVERFHVGPGWRSTVGAVLPQTQASRYHSLCDFGVWETEPKGNLVIT